MPADGRVPLGPKVKVKAKIFSPPGPALDAVVAQRVLRYQVMDRVDLSTGLKTHEYNASPASPTWLPVPPYSTAAAACVDVQRWLHERAWTYRRVESVALPSLLIFEAEHPVEAPLRIAGAQEFHAVCLLAVQIAVRISVHEEP